MRTVSAFSTSHVCCVENQNLTCRRNQPRRRDCIRTVTESGGHSPVSGSIRAMRESCEGRDAMIYHQPQVQTVVPQAHAICMELSIGSLLASQVPRGVGSWATRAILSLGKLSRAVSRGKP